MRPTAKREPDRDDRPRILTFEVAYRAHSRRTHVMSRGTGRLRDNQLPLTSFNSVALRRRRDVCSAAPRIAETGRCHYLDPSPPAAHVDADIRRDKAFTAGHPRTAHSRRRRAPH